MSWLKERMLEIRLAMLSERRAELDRDINRATDRLGSLYTQRFAVSDEIRRASIAYGHEILGEEVKK